MSEVRKFRGVTLVEILVALAILAAVFIPAFELFRSGASTARYTEDRLRAFLIAQQQIEILKHACTINKYSTDKLVGELFKGGNPRRFVVEGRYHVALAADTNFQVEAEGKKAVVCNVKCEVDWEANGEARHVELEALIDRVYR
ncbi:MAG: prepilin-type N-terminal cleavage/methylation domain-containing protein [Candidatus Wallbacteria bacterium]|nr:prepilin-type N-terminal cleavage/methylation domain-containing protein [Candidatus Wallbacteria bacterium]